MKLKGKKTYICCALWAILGIVKSAGWYDVPEPLMIALLGAAGISMRQGMPTK